MQISEEELKRYYPEVHDTTVCVNHILNGTPEMLALHYEKQRDIIKPRAIFTLIDQRTDNGMEKVCDKFKVKYSYGRWEWDFADMKNKALEEARKHIGLRPGEMVVTQGFDWEMLDFDTEWAKNPRNVIASVAFKEADMDVSNYNTIVYRWFPECKWKLMVDEKVWPAFYAKMRIGTGKWGCSDEKEPPIVGHAIHHGYKDKGEEKHLYTQSLYYIMALYQERMNTLSIENDWVSGTLDAKIKTMQKVLNNPSIKTFEDFDRTFRSVVDRYHYDGDWADGLTVRADGRETLTDLMNRIMP